jgi:uncharacterized membrane protein
MVKKIVLVVLAVLVVLIAGFLVIGYLKPVYNGTVSVTVNAPVSKTFAVFNDVDNMGKWMNNFKGIKNISGEKNEVGSKWQMSFDENGRSLLITETVTAFEQDKHFAFNMDDDFASFKVDIRFEEKNGQTIITQTSEGGGKGVISRSLIALMGGRIQKQQVEMYDKLKALVENS